MVPKGYFPLDLKISSKGLSWVDLMYQKIEAICEGVDKDPPAIIQETSRFIDQISTVGANMQKLCSDFMDDILPSVTEVDDKCLSSKFTAKSEEDLTLTENSDQEKDTIETLICEEVDKNPSALTHETTSFIEHQMSTAGANMQKFCSDLMEDILLPVAEVDHQCISSKLSVNSKEDLKLTEKSDPEKGTTKTSNCESLASPDVHQDAAIEIRVLDVKKQLSTSCLQEEIVFLKSTDEDSIEVKTTEFNFGADTSEKVFEDKGSLQERNCLWEHAEPLISQTNMLLKSNIELLANRSGAAGTAEQRKNGSMDLAGRIKLQDPSIPEDNSLLENGILEVNLEEFENVEQNHPDEDVGRVLSAVESYITNAPTCSKEGNLKKSLYLEFKEKEQVACWYGNPYVQAQKGIDMPSSNSFVDITESCRWPDVENSDSEWELL